MVDPNKFTEKTLQALNAAQELALEHGHQQVTPLHLAIVVFEDSEGIGRQAVLKCANEDALRSIVRVLKKKLVRLPQVSPPPDQAEIGNELRKVLQNAIKLQKKRNDTYLSVDTLLLALLENKDLADALNESGLSKSQLESALTAVRGDNKTVDSRSSDQQFEALTKFGTDLTAKAAQLDPIIGRDEEIRRVVRILCRRTKNNPVLIGEPGVGKTAIVEGLAQRIVNGDVPATLRQMRVISLDMSALVAGTKFRGEFEERIQNVLKEVTEAKNIILFIDEMHLVLGAGKTEGAMDAANMLKPMLARGELRCIGATTIAEYRQYIEKDAAFERRFQQVYVEEPSVEDTIVILRGIAERYASFHGVRISDRALVAAAELSARYIQGRFLPDKAIDLVDEACANKRVQLESVPEEIDNMLRQKYRLQVEEKALSKEKDKASHERLAEVRKELAALEEKLRPLIMRYEQEKKDMEELRALQKKREELRVKLKEAEARYDLAMVADLKYGALADIEAAIRAKIKSLPPDSMLSAEVTAEDVAVVVSRWTGIPVQRLCESEKERLLRLGEELHMRIVGQEEAVAAVAASVLRSRAGLASRNRGASFLFLGPTGVGKTELAKALAELLFGDEKLLIRLDMGEYMEKHTVARLIGAPPGYIGHDEGGQLTEAVRRRPYSVVLLDEVEKAHREVMNVLLAVLDDGRLTDAKGRTVNFANTVTIMTSNLGSDLLLERGNAPAAKELVMQVVKRHFRPEFLNRLDDVVMFEPLGAGHLRKIARLQVGELNQRLKHKHITLTLTDAALDYAAQQSFDHMYGARPLRRWMEKTILTDLSRMLVSGELSEYAVVHCDVAPDGSGLAYKVERAEPVPGVPEQQDSKRARWAGASKLEEDDEEMEE
ncbi:hypothetical protein WJX81_007123 [Elliptochloris bilobata]|uniref:Clp R domain-containing protein n=1 Tax=Elliptochloris bilobata TaxID=381761 RepID=A0AAW1SD52_9CHLO